MGTIRKEGREEEGRETNTGKDVEKLEHVALLVGMQHGTMENSLAAHRKMKSRITIGSSHSTSESRDKRIESKVSKRYLHTHAHSSIVHNG